MKKIAILGSGSWASALIKILSENISEIGWWIYKKETADFILLNSSNPTYLTKLKLPLDRLKIFTDLNLILKQYDVFILAIPSIYIKEVFNKIKIPIDKKVFISSIKGIIPENKVSVIDFLETQYQINLENLGVIAGPCHAEEIVLEKTSYLTLGFNDKKKADFIARALNSFYVKTIYSKDLKGITLSSILKNIFSIASGISKGLGYGDNFQAVLISNATKEMQKILDFSYPFNQRNLSDSAYLGDLLVSAYSPFSRNYSLGKMLGEGKKIEVIFKEMKMIAEGYYATEGIYETYCHKILIPIIETVYKILYQKNSSKEEFEKLKEKLN